MFDRLSENLTNAFRKIRGRGRLSEDNIAEVLRELRTALLEADVAFPVVQDLIARLREGAIGQEVQSSLTPSQAMVKFAHSELVALMGGQARELRWNVAPPAVILVAGLQGAGKTTTIAKLGRWLRAHGKKSVMVCSCDVYRPAAIEQLRILAADNDLVWKQAMEMDKPEEIASAALADARTHGLDTLIVDTAGRLHVDEEMMDEVRRLHGILSPIETLFVIDSMMGQDAIEAARGFSQKLELTGAVLTKVDGDARGGAALTVRAVTGVPILFMGTGEKMDEFVAFHPERIASRILGMGDVLSLVEEIESKTSREEADKLSKKLGKGAGLDLEDMRGQLRQLQGLGGISSLLDKLPNMGKISAAAEQMDPRTITRMVAIIDSMTPRERRHPEVINGSRKRRIAAGSGTEIQEVNRLLKQHKQAGKLMKGFAGKGGARKMMRRLQQPGGGGNIGKRFR
ncbi:MAG: signal recognition particle protein [Candidatus Eutrophobiaceae bacterium]